MAHRRDEAGRAPRWARVSYWREKDAREAVEAWRSSQESLAGFARRHGVNPQRLSWWRKRLEVDRGQTQIEFLPVRLAASPSEGSTTLAGSMEVLLASGRRLRLGSDFDEAAVLRLVRLLEAAPC